MPRWVWWLLGLGLVAAVAPATVGLVGSLAEEARIARLRPEVAALVRQLRDRLAALGIRLFVGSTRRTAAEQASLVAAGKSAATTSWHQLGRAADVYPYDPTTGKPDLAGRHVENFRALAREAQALGFRSLGFTDTGAKRYIQTAKGPIWDAGHIEYRGPYATIAAAAAAEGAEVVA
jgi:hypothetical protein